MNRSAGVLLAVSSLPSKHGIGCFDRAAYDFIDWLKEAGQTYWQILPLGPTSYGESGDSPYQSYSAFAGNPYFISLDALVEEGFLKEEEVAGADLEGKDGNVDYDKLHIARYSLLRTAYERSGIYESADYQNFLNENAWWLNDYALFMALKNFFGMENYWNTWPEDICGRWDYAMSYYNEQLYFDIEFQKFLQYEFYKQWTALKTYANASGIRIVGDIPIYVSLDSADVWAHKELFQLNEKGFPTDISGCPPDGFSATGQIWGNPLYRWDFHRQTDYSWWISRMWNSFRLYDVVRIDHFRGFDEYFSIPSDAKTALSGHWEKGPGIELFRRIEAHLGQHTVIAEDLGLMTDTVRQLVKDSGFPNMKVLEFGFDPEDIGMSNDYLPHNYGSNCVAYTGTHDNDTVMGWFTSLSKKEKDHIREYMGDCKTPLKNMNRALIALVMRTNADTVIIPIQDYLGLGQEGRMNIPSTVGLNWRWRLKGKETDSRLAEEILRLTKLYGRFNWNTLGNE